MLKVQKENFHSVVDSYMSSLQVSLQQKDASVIKLTMPVSYTHLDVYKRQPHKEELARQIAESHHTTYQLFAPWRHWTERGRGLEACILPPIERWLEGILNARCVVTDSFHGVAFSLIFGKPFVAIVNSSACLLYTSPACISFSLRASS